MKNKRLFLMLITLAILIVTTASPVFTYGNGLASQDIKVFVNEKQVIFDVPPTVINNRVLVPLRGVFESLGASVTWNSEKQTVTVLNNDIKLELKPDSKIAYKNGQAITLDVPPVVINNRTLVPIRFVSESLGANVQWDNASQSVLIHSEKLPSFTYKGIALGTNLTDVKRILGEPKRIDVSEYDFKWYVFHDNYKDYVQLGIKNNQVAAIYSNNSNWENKYGITINSKQEYVLSKLPASTDRILKGNTYYLLPQFDQGPEYHLFDMGDHFLTIFYDLHSTKQVTAIQLIAKESELKYIRGQYSSTELRTAFERQVFDLANSIRVRMGLKPFEWSDQASQSALKHSQDMSINNYFNHNNLKGESPFDRMKKEGIQYSTAGENLAAGQQNAIYAHENWMNSLGHRQAILGNFQRLGVGVWFGDLNKTYHTYFTQNFYTTK